MAKKNAENFVARAIRPYEQEPGGGFGLLPVWIVRAPLGQVDGGGADNRPNVPRCTMGVG